MSSHQLAQIDDWPTVPNKILIQTIRTWWAEHREGWSASVHGFYNGLGSGLMFPFRKAKEMWYGEAPLPFEEYRKKEWAAMVRVVEGLYTKLTWMSELDNNLLKPRLEKLLQGQTRQALLKQLQESHESLDLSFELTRLVESKLATFQEDSPGFYKLFKRLDHVAAASRPVASVVLFVTGLGPVGHAVTPLLTDAAAQTALHVASDVGAGTVTATVGETVLSSTASSGIGYLESRFRHLHESFIEQRAKWLAEQIRVELLGDLVLELQESSLLPESRSFQEANEIQELFSVAEMPSMQDGSF